MQPFLHVEVNMEYIWNHHLANQDTVPGQTSKDHWSVATNLWSRYHQRAKTFREVHYPLAIWSTRVQQEKWKVEVVGENEGGQYWSIILKATLLYFCWSNFSTSKEFWLPETVLPYYHAMISHGLQAYSCNKNTEKQLLNRLFLLSSFGGFIHHRSVATIVINLCPA